MNGGCFCALGSTRCNCGLAEPCAVAPVKTPEEESPWLWLLYAFCVVIGAALSTIFWRAK